MGGGANRVQPPVEHPRVADVCRVHLLCALLHCTTLPVARPRLQVEAAAEDRLDVTEVTSQRLARAPRGGDSPCGTDGDDGDGQGSRFWAGAQRPPQQTPRNCACRPEKFGVWGAPKHRFHRKGDRELQPAALYISNTSASPCYLSSLHPEACCCCHCFCRCFPHASSIAAILMARTTATQLLAPPLRLPPMRLPPACAYLPSFALRFSALSAAQRRLMLTPLSSVEGRKCPFLLYLLLLS